MIRKDIFCTVILTAAFCAGPPTASAFDSEKLLFIPRASVGVSDYSFEESSRPGALGGEDFPALDFNVTFTMLGAGATLFYDRFYLDGYYQGSTDESDTFEHTFDLPGFGVLPYREKFTGDRTDYSVALGVKVLDDKGAVFVGYKGGTSQADGTNGTKLKFEEDGFFVGANYGWTLFDKGVLSINVAVARMDGELTQIPGGIFATAPWDLTLKADGDTTGFSGGIAWNSSITEKLTYSISANATSYTFDNLKNKVDTGIPPPKEAKEEFVTFLLSIGYVF